jgi:hypothetical protein
MTQRRSKDTKAAESGAQLPAQSQFLLYTTEDGQKRIEVRLDNETVWMTQIGMAELFKTTVSNINIHLKNIYAEGELSEPATIKEYLIVRQEGKRRIRRSVKHYDLEAILSVGYRVKSLRGTQFRQWATERLKEYIVKGFTMDDERLKNPPVAGSAVPDYFDEMLARIRDIRASERRMYLRVKEILAMAGDYDPSWSETTKFFSVIQNKLHFAATGLTAAELIQSRADHTVSNMGLTCWKAGEVSKTDVTVAKNYLKEDEIDELNRIVVMWLDFAEDQARRRKQVFMKDWEQKLDEFLRFNERRVLPHAGSVSKKDGEEHARLEYDKFARSRREYKEAVGEVESIKALEEAAKQFANPGNHKVNESE